LNVALPLTAWQLAYGLGTAHYKSDPNSPEDPELVKTVVMAIKTGYYHLDGAEGI
jgi:diketogulonate reductase-like aldo/keto reductase